MYKMIKNSLIGTGAAGEPTFGAHEILKYNIDAKLHDLSKILLGSALVLPYFEIAYRCQPQRFDSGYKGFYTCVMHVFLFLTILKCL